MRRVTVILILLLVFSLSANADIISTNVSVDMLIRYDYLIDASGTGSGATQADVYLTGSTTGITTYSELEFTYLSAEEANLEFAIGWDMNEYSSSDAYIGHSTTEANYAEISYAALVESTLDYSWDFAYSGADPFGLQMIQILEDGSEIQRLGDFGAVGTHDGSDTSYLMADENYLFQVHFWPSVGTSNPNLQGDLIGSIEFDFNGSGGLSPVPGSSIDFDFNGGGGPSPVPEPATMLLFGTAL